MALLGSLFLTLATPAEADPGGFTVAHSFTNTPDGMNPDGGLTLGSDGHLYGTSVSGGCYAPGTVLSIGPDGASYDVLHSFAWSVAQPPCQNGSYGWGDGTNPHAAPIDGGDGWLYGTTLNNFFGGNGNDGTLYRIHPDGSGYQILHWFDSDNDPNSIGYPWDQLVKGSDGDLYGTASSGGPGSCGGVFRLQLPVPASGAVEQDVADFCPAGAVDPPKDSVAGLVDDGAGTFYGVSEEGGALGYGTIFKVVVDPQSGAGTVTTLHSFAYGEGVQPEWQLIEGPDGALYGTTPFGGGGNNDGSVFRVTPDGTFTTLVSMGWARGPQSPLVEAADGTLVGTAWGGGADNDGIVYAVDDCGNISYLHSFDGAGGRDVLGNIVLDGSTLWGTTQSGGADDVGTIWSLPIPSGSVDSVGLTSSDANSNAGSPVTLTATITSAAQTSPAGTVEFYDGATLLGTGSVSNGQAILVASSLAAGSHALTASYCGITSPTLSQTVQQQTIRPTTVTYTGPTQAVFHQPLAVSGTLEDASVSPSIPVAGRTLTFTLGIATCGGTTNSEGSASCVLPVYVTPGAGSVEVSFGGDGTYESSSVLAPITVAKDPTTLNLTGPQKVANGEPAALSGVLSETVGGAPVAGRTVAFTLGTGSSAQGCSAITDASGEATCTVPSVAQPPSATSATLGAVFSGDSDYLSSEASGTAPLLYYTGRAFDVSIQLASLSPTVIEDTGSVQTSTTSSNDRSIPLPISTLGMLTLLDARVATGHGTSSSSASLGTLVLAVPDVGVVEATGVAANSQSTCSVATGGATIGSLTVGSDTIRTGTLTPNTVIHEGPVTITLDEQSAVAGASEGRLVNAIDIAVSGVTEVIIGSARSDIHNC